MDAATDAEIARLLAEDQAYYGGGAYDYYGGEPDSDSDPDYGKAKKKTASKKKKASTKAAPEQDPETTSALNTINQDGVAGPVEGQSPKEEDALTANGRRKRKDTGQQRTASRSWTDDEERLFLEALTQHGRDWKKCAEHVGSRDHRAIASHAQKFLIKALLKGEELPGKMAESGRGYTLSGKPLDPNSAAARAYGLKPVAFQRVVDSGFLQVGVHVTTLELDDPPPTSTGQNAAKRPRSATTSQKKKMGQSDDEEDNNGGDDHDNVDGCPIDVNHRSLAPSGAMTQTLPATNATTNTNMNTATADAVHNNYYNQKLAHSNAAINQPTEPTEYAKNRPRRQLASAKAQLGETTESLDLTWPSEFVGPIAAGAPLSQPFSVTITSEALLVMDFHAHLSTCEIIGLLGGTFNPDSKSLSITAAYPCRRAQGSDSSTSVELDAESQVEVACAMEERGLVPIGWYHSHPVFEPRPSAKDNENQRNYQALCRDQVTGLEPWVGAIVGPYDSQLPTAASKIQLWVVRQSMRQLTPYNIKHTRLPPNTVPTPGSDVELQLINALEHCKDDAARIEPREQWRPYARLVQGTPDGGPLTNGAKIQLALRMHLPRDQPVAVNEFLSRVRGLFVARWGVEVPEFTVTTPSTNETPNEQHMVATNSGGDGSEPKPEAHHAAVVVIDDGVDVINDDNNNNNNNNNRQEVNDTKGNEQGLPIATTVAATTTKDVAGELGCASPPHQLLPKPEQVDPNNNNHTNNDVTG